MKQWTSLAGIVGFVALVSLCVVFTDLRQDVERQLSSVVGMYASIEPNKHNILTQQIKDKQEDLDAREEEIAKKELLLDQQITPKHDRVAIIYITAIGFLLLVLVILNFVLDWRRRK